MLATMVIRRRKIKRKYWLKHPKAVPQKQNLDRNINDSKSHIWNYFIENIISGIQLFYINPHVPVDSIKFFFFFWFQISRRKSQSQQNMFAQNTSLILRISTRLTLKIKCKHDPKRLSKIFLTLQIFQETCFCLVSEKTFALHHFLHPRTAFLKHFESKFLYISVYLIKKIFVPKT